MNKNPLRGALIAALGLPDDQLKAAISKILAENAPLPAPGQQLDYKGKVGLVHHAFRSTIAPSGVLVGVYRYGPRNSYLGYLDSSQVRAI